jgi:hypothetical protein
MTPCGSCNNGRFERIYRLYHQGEENRRANNNVLLSVLQVLATVNVSLVRWLFSPCWCTRYVPPKTSVITGATRRHIPDDGILHSHRRESLRYYISGDILNWWIVICSLAASRRVHPRATPVYLPQQSLCIEKFLWHVFDRRARHSASLFSHRILTDAMEKWFQTPWGMRHCTTVCPS